MQEAITKDPNNAILYYNLGVINVEQGRIRRCHDVLFKSSLELDPNYAATYLKFSWINS